MKAKLTALLYKAGVLETPEEKVRLRGLTLRQRLFEQSVPQLLLTVALVILLGAGYKGSTGALYALVGSVVVLVALQVYQSVEQPKNGDKP